VADKHKKAVIQTEKFLSPYSVLPANSVCLVDAFFINCCLNFEHDAYDLTWFCLFWCSFYTAIRIILCSWQLVGFKGGTVYL